MITLSKPPWKSREHLFTPENIVKFEKACISAGYKKPSAHVKARALRHGPCIWLIKDGQPVEARDLVEEKMMERGPQEPENRSGEPDQFYLMEG